MLSPLSSSRSQSICECFDASWTVRSKKGYEVRRLCAVATRQRQLAEAAVKAFDARRGVHATAEPAVQLGSAVPDVRACAESGAKSACENA